ncbi:CBS domain-containing protein [Saprospiraceae bacterium]|nr:CBS domain-containing protein [Saprospiraceae bacterium]
MNLLSPVSTIMTKNLVTVRPDDKLSRVKVIFEKHKIHHIPVVDDLKLVGMISKSDYLFFLRGLSKSNIDQKWEDSRLKSHQVDEIMTTKLAKLEADQKINVALEVFKENLFHAVPIVEGEAIVGIVTTWDIINNIALDKVATNDYV